MSNVPDSVLLKVCLAVGVVSTLMFYWLVRQNDRTTIEDNDVATIESSENDRQNGNGFVVGQNNENGYVVVHDENGVVVGQNSNSTSAEKRRKTSKEKDRNLSLTTSEDQLVSEDLFESSNNSFRSKNLENSELKKKMTIRRWFKQPQLYQVVI